MGINKSNTQVSAIYRGNLQVTKVFKGLTLVYPNASVATSDEQLFFNALIDLNQIQKDAISTLVNELKNNNLWVKMNAIYPFVGGTAFMHKFNLKDPRDSDSAFRLIFNGTVAHDLNGIKGTNAYANTYLAPSASMVNNSTHVSIYSKTNVAGDFIDIGCNSTTDFSPRIVMHTKWSDSNSYFDMNNASNGRLTLNTVSDTLGFLLMSRIASNDLSVYKNNALLGKSTTVNASILPDKPFYLMNANSFDTSNFYSPRQLAFVSIGSGLNSVEAANLYTAIQNFQTSLSRQV